MDDLPLGRTAVLMPEFAVKDLPLDRTLTMMLMILDVDPAGSARFNLYRAADFKSLANNVFLAAYLLIINSNLL